MATKKIDGIKIDRIELTDNKIFIRLKTGMVVKITPEYYRDYDEICLNDEVYSEQPVWEE